MHVWEALLVRMNGPGMNLHMSISAKVADIMIKIADYRVKWSNVAAFLLLFFEILSEITKLFNRFTMAAT